MSTALLISIVDDDSLRLSLDNLIRSAGQDPVTYRRALLGKAAAAKAVLDVAAQAAGCHRPLPNGARSARISGLRPALRGAT